MMKYLLLCALCFASFATLAQVSVKNPDSVRLGNPAGTGSVTIQGRPILKNLTQGTKNDSVLVRDASGVVKFVKQSSFAGGAVQPAGSNGQIQFNDGGVLGASSLLTFQSGTLVLLSSDGDDSKLFMSAGDGEVNIQSPSTYSQMNFIANNNRGMTINPNGGVSLYNAPTGANSAVRKIDLDNAIASISSTGSEVSSNKQNSLAADAGNLKYPTVTAVNAGLDLKATDATVVHLAGTETIAGSKTFTTDLNVRGVSLGTGPNSVYGNSVFGAYALFSNAGGGSNTAIGSNSLFLNSNGSSNTGLGAFTLVNNTLGSNNTAVGTSSMQSNTFGFQNTSLGVDALGSNTTGGNNVAVGLSALITNTTGSSNTAIGGTADVTTANLNNATAIGYDAKVDASNKVVLGNPYVTAVQLGGASAVTTTGQVKLTAGAPGLGKVLTSDANGLGSWQIPAGGTGGGGSGSWGSIGGALSDQTDLSNVLNAKANLIGGNFITGEQSIYNNVNNGLSLGALALGQLVFRSAINLGTSNGNTVYYGNLMLRKMRPGGYESFTVNFIPDLSASGTYDVVIPTAAGKLALTSDITTALNINNNTENLQMVTSRGASTTVNSTFNNAKIGSWSNNAAYARFGHSLFDGANTYGFLQDNSGNSYVAGTSVNFNTVSGGQYIFNVGNVGIGTTGPTQKLDVLGNGSFNNGTYGVTVGTYTGSAGYGAIYAKDVIPGNGNYAIVTNQSNTVLNAPSGGEVNIAINGTPYFYLKSTGQIGIGGSTATESLYVTGNIYATGSITPGSDLRLKKNVVDLPSSINKVMQMRPVNYDLKADNSNHNGVIAQEVIKISPELVRSGKTDEDMMGVDYNGLTATLLKAIQEQQKMIELLKARIEVLEKKR